MGARRTCSRFGVVRVLDGESFRGGDGMTAPAPAASEFDVGGGSICSLVILSPSSIPPDRSARFLLPRNSENVSADSHLPIPGIKRKSHVTRGTHRTWTSVQYPRTHMLQLSSKAPNCPSSPSTWMVHPQTKYSPVVPLLVLARSALLKGRIPRSMGS